MGKGRAANPYMNQAKQDIEAYYINKQVAEGTRAAIKVIEEKMTAPRIAQLTGLPSAHNPQAGEERLVSQIDTKTALENKLRETEAQIAIFEIAWNILDSRQQEILTEFYGTGNQRSGATWRLGLKYHYSDRTIDYRRSEALKRLTNLLYCGVMVCAS
jgi:hypothetical protein